MAKTECGLAEVQLDRKVECSEKNRPECGPTQLYVDYDKKIVPECGQNQLWMDGDNNETIGPECGPEQPELQSGIRMDIGCSEENVSECGRAKLGLEYDNIVRDGPECGSVKENDGPTGPVQLEPECGYEMETECGMTNKTIPEYGPALQENEKMEIDCDPAQLYERVSLRKRKRSGKMRYRLKRVVGWEFTEQSF